MDTTSQQLSLPSIADILDPPQTRKSGYHITSLISAAISMSKLETPEPDGDIDDTTGMMALGRIWEAASRPYLNSYFESLGLYYEPSIEWEKDGIIGNLDGLVLADTPVGVVETKLTTRRNPDPTTNYKWLSQAKSYCYIAGVPLAWFLVLHIPRSGPPTATPYLYTIQFSDQELEEIWGMLTATRDYLEASNGDNR